ncbi:MAG: hypothetical protein AAF715_30035 [Myxococcota bacterium]
MAALAGVGMVGVVGLAAGCPSSVTRDEALPSSGPTEVLPPREGPLRPAPVPGAPVSTDGRRVTLAVKRWLLGDVDWRGAYDPEGWRGYSFDLVGDDAPDNAFGRILLFALDDFAETRWLSPQSEAAIVDGTRSLLLVVDDLAAEGPQSEVVVETVLAGPRAAPPRFDGDDVWPQRRADADGATLVADYRGYIADDVFVAGPDAARTQRLELTFRTYPFRIRIHEAVVSIDLRSVRTGGDEAYGIITGIIRFDELDAAYDGLAIEMFQACQLRPENTFGKRYYGDAGPEKADFTVGIGFVASLAEAGSVAPEPPVRPEACTGSDPPPASGPLAGTCGPSPPVAQRLDHCYSYKRKKDSPPEFRDPPVACARSRPRGPVCRYSGTCDCHDMCTDGVNGRCSGGCTYDACFSDDDCAPGTACVCAFGTSRWREDDAHACVEANCRSDDDCPGAERCRLSGNVWCAFDFYRGYFCTTADDTCKRDADCVDDRRGNGQCNWDEAQSAWRCVYERCTAPP